MPHVIIDIETKHDKKLLDIYAENIKPNSRLKDTQKIKEDIEKKREKALMEMALDHDYSDIICVGVKVLDKPAVIMTPKEFADWLNVDSMQSTTQRAYKRYETLKFITFNGKNFDFPILIKHGMKNNLKLPYKLFKNQSDKYKAANHIDLMDVMSIVWGQYKSLDTYLQIYLGIKKTPIDFQTASVQEIKRHCLEDLHNTEKLFKFVDGHLGIL